MISNPENRDKTRFNHQSPVTLENNQIGLLRSARMYNYSDWGLYIESDHRLDPETEVRIGITKSPFASEPDKYESYRGIIKWRRSLQGSSYYYGYGVEILEKSARQKYQSQFNGLRKHPRIDCAIPLKYEFDSRTYQGTTKNVSSGGVFIKTPDLVAVGQPVIVYIPLKKKGKIKRLQGRVTWSDLTGFGVKFGRLM